MEKSIPKGTKCADCKKEIKIGDENIGFWKKEGLYRCGDCTDEHFSTENYTRVVGYLRPVKQFNIGKVEEYKDRKEFIIK